MPNKKRRKAICLVPETVKKNILSDLQLSRSGEFLEKGPNHKEDRMLKYSRIVLVVSIMLLVGCSSGEKYETGFLRRENISTGLFFFHRGEDHVSYSIFYDNVITCGATSAGNQYTCVLFGAWSLVNFPSWPMLLYPLQYHDTPDDARVFGIGTGEGDFRISILYGLLTIGRNWNIFYINGFWIPSNDPLFNYKNENTNRQTRSEDKDKHVGKQTEK